MKIKIVLALFVVAAVGFAVGRSTTAEPALHEQTKHNLTTAMQGEAFAHAKYLLYAEHARKDGNTELADLFEKTAAVEHLEHLREEAEIAGLIGSDEANLQAAINGETYEVDTMYSNFAREARTAGDHGAADRFEEIRKDEANHRDAFKAALAKLQSSHPHVPGGN